MKKIYLLFFVFVVTFSFGQTNNEIDTHVKNEISRYQKMLATTRNVNPNTLNYDLKYQRLELTLNPASSANITGKVTSHFIPNQDMNSIYFDFNDALTVSEVKYHGSNISFSQLTSNEIKIDFPSTLFSHLFRSCSKYLILSCFVVLKLK